MLYNIQKIILKKFWKLKICQKNILKEIEKWEDKVENIFIKLD